MERIKMKLILQIAAGILLAHLGELVLLFALRLL